MYYFKYILSQKKKNCQLNVKKIKELKIFKREKKTSGGLLHKATTPNMSSKVKLAMQYRFARDYFA